MVLGDTRALKERLKSASCKWNKALTVGGERTGGWIFPWSRLADVEKVTGLVAAGSASAALPVASAAAASPPDADAAAPGSEGDDGAVELFSSASGSFIVCGKTWEKREAYKAAGGVWRSGWSFPGTAHAAVLGIMVAAPPAATKKRRREAEAGGGGGAGSGGGGGGGGGSASSSGE